VAQHRVVKKYFGFLPEFVVHCDNVNVFRGTNGAACRVTHQ
jgi:hypothetical protein